MRLYLNDIKNTKTKLLYEQAFLHFVSLKGIFYFLTPILKENSGAPVPIYRSIIAETNSVSTDIKDLEYRPANGVSTFGRVNRPCQAYFYACDNAPTCWSEQDKRIKSELEKKEEITIVTSQWILQRDLTLCVIPNWHNESMSQFNQKIDLLNFSQETKDFLTGINELLLAEDDNSNIYKVTSAFFNAILYDRIKQKKDFDGFLYTSVKDKTGYNLALFPRLVNNKDIILTNACKTCISKKDIEKDEYYSKPYIEKKQIDFENGKINWQ